MRVLVTGGAGYIGSVVAARLLADGHAVTVLDDLSTGHRDAVPDGAGFVPGSVQDTDAVGAVLEQLQPEAVLHFAARSIVGESIADPGGYWQNNVLGTLALLVAMRAHGVARIVFSSSAAVYSAQAQAPIEETAPTAPANPYGATKLAIDHALTGFARAYGLVAVSLRYFNVAGALQLPDGRGYGERHRHETHLIPLALRAATGDAEPLSVYGTDYPTPDGTCIRDYVHVVDLADAHVRALELGEPGEHHVVNLGSGCGYSVRGVLDAVAAVTGTGVPAVDAGRRPGDPPVLVASNELAAKLLGWSPQRDLPTMIDDAWRFAQGA
ncbi:MAG TPA: UDP-glucose 4-epimerase GalE [Jatrophihabitantaceae bacterium]|jgi:UDP-glucose 4-epimerase